MPQLLVQFRHLSKYFSTQPLFEDLSLSIHRREIIALIGENGAGKTTLLSLLASKSTDLRVGFLPQEIPASAGLVRDFLEDSIFLDFEDQMAYCLETDQLALWAELHQRYVELGGYQRIETNLIKMPNPKRILGLKFQTTPLLSSVPIELEEIAIAFREKTVISNFSETLSQGERIILSGPNGSGKTTLLRCIAGDLIPCSGILRIAKSVKIGYLDQEAALLPMDQAPLEYFEKHFQLPEEALRRELHKAAIGGAELLKRPFSTLSTGQRKRFSLLSLILEKPNVLLLDEPTNHLDLLVLEALETALLNFKGAIIAVSHDSTFIEKIATRSWRLSALS